jgi:putative heme-binding domain-containing protein
MKSRHCLAIILALAASLVAIHRAPCADAAPDPDDPATERATFKVAKGFDVELFASEKDGVVKPIQIRFDARGRMWVVQSSSYPQPKPGEVPDDKVLILEDTTGSGKCDKVTVFSGGLTIPTGIELGDGGAYVGAGTKLWFLKDTHGGDTADDRRIVLRGFGTGDTHQTLNSFAWGPGGELWMCQGLSVRSRVETPFGIRSLSGAGIWRLDVHTLHLEPFFGGAAEPQNPWGFVFTDFGEQIVLAGNNSSPFYAAPGLTSAHHEAGPKLIWPQGSGRKVSGGDIVGTAHWPDSWQGALLMGGYINNAVWALDIKDDGAGFRLEDRPALITSTSQSFRPVDVKFGPDGALYICDWYNPIIGHYQASFRDPRRDQAHGRIWRVTATGRPLTKRPELTGATLPQLLDDLESHDRWTRHFAKRELASRPVGQVLPAVRAWAAEPGRSDLGLTEALGVFQSHAAVEPDLLMRLCHARTPGARAYAAGAVGGWADRLADPLALLAPLVADEDPRVRLRAVVSCSYIAPPGAVGVALGAVERPVDEFTRYALDQTVYALKPQWISALKSGTLDLGGADRAARLSALVRFDGTPDTVEALRDLLRRGPADAPGREGFLHLLADVGGADDLATVLKTPDPAQLARLLPAVAEAAERRNVRPPGDLAAIVTDLLARPEEAVRAGAPGLAAAWNLQSLRGAMESLARDTKQPAGVRRAAVLTLPRLGSTESRETLLALAGDPNPPPLRAAAVDALGAVDPQAAAAQAAAWLAPAGHADDATAEELFRALLKRPKAAAALAGALTATTPSADAAKIGLRVASSLGSRDEALAAALSAAAGLNRTATLMTPAEVEAFAADAKAHGDSARGAKIFARPELSCMTCHSMNGKGGHIGPDLGNLGTAQTVEFIIGSILEPNREVKEGYMSYEVTTKSGDTYQAYILREDAGELVIRDLAHDAQVRLRKDTITKKTQRGSVMPPGLADTLTRAEFRDLVRYLASTGHAGQ